MTAGSWCVQSFAVKRTRHLALAALLCGVAPALAVTAEALAGFHDARASDGANEAAIDVGTELMATSDVTLHRAEIAKGSKVSVTKVQVDGLNVALADGHVVKVTMAQVHTYFRVVDE